MVCGWIWFLSNDLCVFYPWALTHNKLNKNHIQPQTMGDFFYHMLQHHFLSLHKYSLLHAKVPSIILTVLHYNPLWCHRSGIWKIYPMGDIHRIWNQTCDKSAYLRVMFFFYEWYSTLKWGFKCTRLHFSRLWYSRKHSGEWMHAEKKTDLRYKRYSKRYNGCLQIFGAEKFAYDLLFYVMFTTMTKLIAIYISGFFLLFIITVLILNAKKVFHVSLL